MCVRVSVCARCCVRVHVRERGRVVLSPHWLALFHFFLFVLAFFFLRLCHNLFPHPPPHTTQLSPTKWHMWKTTQTPHGKQYFVNEENGERCWHRPSLNSPLIWYLLRAIARAAPEAFELIKLTVVLLIRASPRRIRRKQSWSKVAAAEFVPAVVVDAGTSATRVGFGGDRTPRAVFPPVMTHNAAGEYVIGEEALMEGCRRGAEVKVVIQRGLVADWEGMERMFQHIFTSKLRIDSSAHPVLITEPPLNPQAARERLAALLFDTFKSPAVYMASQPALVMQSTAGYGIVVDSGDSTTHVVPVYFGHAIPHATQSLDLAGHDLTQCMMKMVNDRAEAVGYSFASTIEDAAEGTMATRGEQPYHTARKMKEVVAYVALDFEAEVASAGTPQNVPLDLPNGESILVGNARFWAPEALFLPALLGSGSAGLHELVVSAVDACDPELAEGMYDNIMLTGGTTNLPGILERLEKELAALRPDVPRISVISPPDRRHAVWAGGAALAGTSRFMHMWVNRKEYAEGGAKIINRKCF